MKASSRQEFMKLPLQQVKKIDRWDSLRGSTSDTFTEETFGPLSNVRFAVFALGSSAYPNFCAFGQYVDNILGELGGERLLRVAYGDEMCGQEQSFRKWAPEVFKVSAIKQWDSWVRSSFEIKAKKGLAFWVNEFMQITVRIRNMVLAN